MSRSDQLRRKMIELDSEVDRLNSSLAESESRWFKLFHASSSPMMITTADQGIIVDLNHSSAQLFEYERSELLGCQSVMLYSDPNRRRELIQRFQYTGRVTDFEIGIKTKSSGSRTVLLAANAINIEDQLCLACIFTDITSREKETLSLRQSEEQYRALVENSLQGITISQAGRIVFCNSAFAEMTGYSVEELLSFDRLELPKLVHTDDRPHITRHYRDILADRPVQSKFEIRGVRKDATTFWTQASACRINYHGRPAIQTACVDITELKRAEKAASEISERLALVLEGTGMATQHWDVPSGHMEIDPRWVQMLGYEPDEIEPHIDKWNELIHPADLPRIQASFENHSKGETPFYDFEGRVRHKAGHWVWTMSRGKIVERDSAGNPQKVVGIHMDITDRKSATYQIQQLANEQKTILNTVSLGIIYIKKRSVQWINPAFAQMFGYTDPKDNAIFLEAYKDINALAFPRLAKGEVYKADRCFSRKDGSTFWGTISGRAINPQDPEEGSIWVLQDIMERRQSEEALRASEERFKRLLENSSDVIAVLDQNGAQQAIHGQMELITGYRPEELLGASGFEKIHPDDLESVMKTFWEILKQPGVARRFEFRYQHKAGNWVFMEAVGTNLLTNELVKGIVLNLRDISERNRLQQQLQQAMKMEAVGVLADGVAHDFNNLLSVIRGYSELLVMDTPEGDPKRADMEQIEKAADRATSLTSQLLAFSRKQVLQPEVLNLNEIVTDMGKMLRRLIGEDIELTMIVQPNLELVSADPAQIQQIIMNIAVNARDAMPRGGKFIIETNNVVLDREYAREHPSIQPGLYAMLAFSDNGTGMDEETRSRIFEPFFTTKKQGKGTGLGLSTVYGIVKQSGGHIWTYSEPGQGTTFKIYFPRVKMHRSGNGESVKAQADSNAAGKTVLIAEDEAYVRTLAARILRERGYHVIEAESGTKALEMAKEFGGKIDLVLTDVVMPGLSGSELVSAIRGIQPEIKALFISGYTDSAIVHHGLLDAKDNFLQKPFTVAGLANNVRKLLQTGAEQGNGLGPAKENSGS